MKCTLSTRILEKNFMWSLYCSCVWREFIYNYNCHTMGWLP